jgi:hypothetical protein
MTVYIVLFGKGKLEVYENYDSAVQAQGLYEDEGLLVRLYECEVITD